MKEIKKIEKDERRQRSMGVQKKLNKVLYDSIFKAMFRGIDDNNENEELNLQIKKDFLEFYKKYCNPSSELQPEDIQPFNLLEKKIFSDYHNDLAYLVKGNRLIALFEHQTTYNPNMPSRLFNYYSMLLNKFWKEKNIDLTISKKFEPPAPELYVIEVFPSREERKEKTKNNNSTYSVRIDPMFDSKGFVNRELIRFDATVIHFDTEEIYQQYIQGNKPEDLIHEFALYYSMNYYKFIELLTNNQQFQTLVLERQKIIEEEKEKEKKEEKKKAIEKELAKIRNRIKSSAARDIMELFQKEEIFTTIFERMGEENMTDLTMKIDREQNIEGMYADFVFTILNERKQVKEAKEQAETAKEQAETAREQAETAREQAEKEREEKEEMKNRLIQIFGTDDLDEIKKMRESNL